MERRSFPVIIVACGLFLIITSLLLLSRLGDSSFMLLPHQQVPITETFTLPVNLPTVARVGVGLGSILIVGGLFSWRYVRKEEVTRDRALDHE